MKAVFLSLGALLLGAVLALAQADGSKARNAADSRFDYAELAKLRKSTLTPQSAGWRGDRRCRRQEAFETALRGMPWSERRRGKKAPSLLVPEVQDATPGALFWVLTNGVVRRGMPVWSKLPEAQRWQMVSYLETLKTSPPSAGTAAK